MRYQLFSKVALALAVCWPMVATAQQPGAVDRHGSWEFSLGAGVMFLDAELREFLASGQEFEWWTDSADPGTVIPTAVARLGYNFNRNIGVSVSGGFATGDGVTYWTPTAAVTYTFDLEGGTSPFLLLGTGVTRINGDDDRTTHAAWGVHAGLGVRHFVNERLALRLEGRIPFENYDTNRSLQTRSRSTIFNPRIIIGLSYFVGGREAPRTARPCPECPAARTRVDTVTVRVPFVTDPPEVIVLADTLVLDGVNFAFDDARLTPGSHRVLDQVARLLQEPRWADVRFEVAGHTSQVGTPEYNMELSQRRAESVRAYLVSRGVEDRRMVARGYGRTQPLYPEGREGDAWQNRRVELRRIP